MVEGPAIGYEGPGGIFMAVAVKYGFHPMNGFGGYMDDMSGAGGFRPLGAMTGRPVRSAGSETEG